MKHALHSEIWKGVQLGQRSTRRGKGRKGRGTSERWKKREDRLVARGWVTESTRSVETERRRSPRIVRAGCVDRGACNNTYLCSSWVTWEACVNSSAGSALNSPFFLLSRLLPSFSFSSSLLSKRNEPSTSLMVRCVFDTIDIHDYDVHELWYTGRIECYPK